MKKECEFFKSAKIKYNSIKTEDPQNTQKKLILSIQSMMGIVPIKKEHPILEDDRLKQVSNLKEMVMGEEKKFLEVREKINRFDKRVRSKATPPPSKPHNNNSIENIREVEITVRKKERERDRLFHLLEMKKDELTRVDHRNRFSQERYEDDVHRLTMPSFEDISALKNKIEIKNSQLSKYKLEYDKILKDFTIYQINNSRAADGSHIGKAIYDKAIHINLIAGFSSHDDHLRELVDTRMRERARSVFR